MPINNSNANFTKIAFINNADCISRVGKHPADSKIKNLITKDMLLNRITTVDAHTILVHSEKINEQYTSSDFKFVGVKDISGKNLPSFKRVLHAIKRFFCSYFMIKKAASEIIKHNTGVNEKLAKHLAKLSLKGELGKIQKKQGEIFKTEANQPEQEQNTQQVQVPKLQTEPKEAPIVRQELAQPNIDTEKDQSANVGEGEKKANLGLKQKPELSEPKTPTKQEESSVQEKQK